MLYRVTDIHGGHVATVPAEQFADTIAAWFPDPPAEVLAGLADVQHQLTAGRFIAGSAISSFGLDIAAAVTIRLCIDTDCPQCGYPERWADVATDLRSVRGYGCIKCGYRSTERTR